jgi:hypothetical protein
MTEEQRDELRQQLTELGAAIAEIEKARKPFDLAISALVGVREALLEQHEADVVGTCEGCSNPILSGELGHSCNDGPVLCEACAPTWNDIRREYDEAKAAGAFEEIFDDPDMAAFHDKTVADRIAVGDGDKKHVWPL